MKTIRLVGLLLLAVLLPLVALARSPKTKTYTLSAYYFSGNRPAPELVERAAREIGAKLRGMAQIADPEEADHSVEILFKKGTYQVYVDALPISPRLSNHERQAMEAAGRFAADMARERRTHHAPEPVQVQ